MKKEKTYDRYKDQWRGFFEAMKPMRDFRRDVWNKSADKNSKTHEWTEVRGFGGEIGHPLCSWFDEDHQCWTIEICLRFHGKGKPCGKVRMTKS